MPKRLLTSTLILLLFFAVAISVFVYGPHRRVFASRNMVASAPSLAGVYELYQSTGVRGRVLILFSRDIVLPADASVFPETKYIVQMLNQGIIRRVKQVMPDTSWSELGRWNLQMLLGYRRTSHGLLVGSLENGRVEYVPFSEFRPVEEQSLVIVDAGSWTRKELQQIAGLIRDHVLDSDLVTVLRGSSSDEELFRPER